jgi:hypothetical protein
MTSSFSGYASSVGSIVGKEKVSQAGGEFLRVLCRQCWQYVGERKVLQAGGFYGYSRVALQLALCLTLCLDVLGKVISVVVAHTQAGMQQ